MPNSANIIDETGHPSLLVSSPMAPRQIDSKTYCVGLSIRSAITWSDRDLKGLLKGPDGRMLSPDEARHHLIEELRHGHEILPFGTCDNWSFQDGCQGHPQ